MLRLWKYLICCSLLALTMSLSAQESDSIIIHNVNEENNVIYEIPDFVPTFPGGEKALKKFLSDNIKHPDDGIYAEGTCLNGLLSGARQRCTSKIYYPREVQL